MNDLRLILTEYHWASEFAPPSLQKIISYFSGEDGLLSVEPTFEQVAD